MAVIELTPPKGRIIELTPPTVPRETLPAEQEGLTATETALGGLQLLTSLGTMMVADVAGGVAGIATTLIPGLKEKSGAAVVEGVKERMTFRPREAGKKVGAELLEVGAELVDLTPQVVKDLGSGAVELFKEAEEASLVKFGPLATTVLVTAPTAILEIIPGGMALKKARQLSTSIADEVVEKSGDALRDKGVDSVKAGAPPEAKDYAEITQDLKTQRAEQVAEQVMPDEEILASAEALGVDLNPSHYSTNRAYIDVENSLKSRAGSKLAVTEERAIRDAGQSADNLVDDMKGATDKSLLDLDIKSDFDTKITSLDEKAGIAYKAVDDAIPKSTEVNPTASREYINRQLTDLGGDKTLLTTAEKKLLRIADEDSHLTYSAIDRIRKDIGSALGKKSGPFKDDDTGTLKQLYKVLSEDQQGVADAFSVGADYAAARKLVSTRKTLEAEAITLFGREVGASIIPKMTQAATALTKGDVSKFNSLMNALPKGRRQEVAATMLNDLFTQGARTQGSLSQGFVKAFQGLQRNKGAKKVLFAQLPVGAEKRFDDIGRVATGIFKSKALENNSRTARDILAALEEGGLIGKLYDKGVKFAPGGPTVSAVTAAVNKVRTPATETADALLTSPAFKQSIESAAMGSLDKSQKIIKTSAFKKWLATQPTNIKTEIAAIGFIPFLTKPLQEEQ